MRSKADKFRHKDSIKLGKSNFSFTIFNEKFIDRQKHQKEYLHIYRLFVTKSGKKRV